MEIYYLNIVSIETDNSIDDESKIKAFNIDYVKIILYDEKIMSEIGKNVIRFIGMSF